MVSVSDLEWMLKESLDSGCFGKDAQLLSYEHPPGRKGQDHFASDVLFYKLTLKVGDETKEEHVVIKVQSRFEELRKYVNTKAQFLNEMLMYSEVLPFLDRDGIVGEIFGKFLHGHVDPDEEEYAKDFIMMEDLSKDGYRLTKEKVFLDYEHCKLAMLQIGRFHALSYAAKQDSIQHLFSYTKLFRSKMTAARLQKGQEMFYLCGKRGVDRAIREEEGSTETLHDFLKNYDDFASFYNSLVEAVEPEAVVCHGDFCRNNMFFKYDDGGRPVSVKFFDLQTPAYSSPVIDLSFFLFLNTSQSLRDNHWDDLLSIYSQAVQSTSPTVAVPTLDFKRVGVYGYLHCSFFLPAMMDENGLDDEEGGHWFQRTPHENAIRGSTQGGEKETKALGDIVRHLLKLNCIKPSYL